MGRVLSGTQSHFTVSPFQRPGPEGPSRLALPAGVRSRGAPCRLTAFSTAFPLAEIPSHIVTLLTQASAASPGIPQQGG